jgi:hypothetical protein
MLSLLNKMSLNIHIRGSAWRDNREFVGQIKYGACYKLWNPSENLSFGTNFRSVARTLLMCQRRTASPLSRLPDDAIYYIINMMRWDWVNDTSVEMVREQKNARRIRRRQMIAEMENASRLVSDETVANALPQALNYPNDGVLGVDEDREDDNGMEDDGDDNDNDDDDEDNMDEDNEDDDSDESLESAVSDEYAWGDHVSSRNAFVYDDESSHSDESDDGDNGAAGGAVARGQQGMIRARRSILSFLRSN